MTTKSLIFGLAALSAVSASPVPQWEETNTPQIVGGTVAKAGDYPFMVSMQIDGFHFCGGSLLDSTTVLTAAHCVEYQSPEETTVRAGSLNRTSGGVVVPALSLHMHPEYNPSITDNDYAIIKLAAPIETSSTIGYATIAAAGTDPEAGIVATTAGWGNTRNATESNVLLRKVEVPIVSREECIANYLADTPPKTVTDNMVCAAVIGGGKDSCQGDSGGPLTDASTGAVIGIVSWGTGCALPNFPGVYARVSTGRDFIDQYL
ncbi:trypsin [Boeremia exigua]|uniref:trypsin n=1 Tax=Boeremia exigua TaxID=749465 RepID=UPI001E8D83E0|nr:trypsin [Boeremia exigua]KAH6629322.1 trypsin [Boeremia exigua]